MSLHILQRTVSFLEELLNGNIKKKLIKSKIYKQICIHLNISRSDQESEAADREPGWEDDGGSLHARGDNW